MEKSYTIADGKNSFSAMVREAEKRGVVEVTRRGQRVAVLMSGEEYERLQGRKENFWEAIERIRSSPDFMPIDDLQDYIQRDRTPDERPNPWL
jgi:prevent-host-death family protein